jgi:hypothetical protein
MAVFSFALGHVCLTLARLRTDDGPTLRVIVVTTLVTVLAVATLLSIAIVGEISDPIFLRITSAIAVLPVLGTALVPLLRAGRRRL